MRYVPRAYAWAAAMARNSVILRSASEFLHRVGTAIVGTARAG